MSIFTPPHFLPTLSDVLEEMLSESLKAIKSIWSSSPSAYRTIMDAVNSFLPHTNNLHSHARYSVELTAQTTSSAELVQDVFNNTEIQIFEMDN